MNLPAILSEIDEGKGACQDVFAFRYTISNAFARSRHPGENRGPENS
jgi:hypothetical protein